MGYIDSDGKIYVLGRADDVINYKGIKIAPDEIENCAIKYEEILDCACVPMSDKMCGQVPKLFIVVKDREKFDEKKYFEFLATVLDPSRLPKRVEIIDEIPRAANGKVKRKQLMSGE
jgi:acyl-coenzyme A synthetase/AMP-(fatty) acid ligase